MEADEYFDANAPGMRDIEAYEDYMRSRGMIHHDGEYVFVQTNEGVQRNRYGDVQTCDEVIVISDDDSVDDGDDDDDDVDEGDDGDDEEEEERSGFTIYRRAPTMGVSTQNLQTFANLFTSSLISDTMRASTATAAATTALTAATTTTTTTAAIVATSPTTVPTITSTTAEPLQQCCICLQNIDRGGIDLHNNTHSIHISCFTCQ